jgi:hypothetical protein
MKYIIKGKGGQGVLFLSRVLAHAFLLGGVENFSFLKEFDEGQRNGEIKITFTLPFNLIDTELVVKQNNIIELKNIVKYFKIDKNNVIKALEIVKPEALQKNLKIWNQ